MNETTDKWIMLSGDDSRICDSNQDCQNAWDEKDCTKSSNEALTIALACLAVVALLLLTLVFVCALRHKKKPRIARETMDQDQNPIYGLYYFSDGRHIDESKSEVTDDNPIYSS